MMQQLQRSKLSAGDIIVPFAAFSALFLKFCVDCSNAAQTRPLFPAGEPHDIIGGKRCPGLHPAPVFLFLNPSNAAGRPERDQRVAGRKNHTLHGENGAL